MSRPLDLKASLEAVAFQLDKGLRNALIRLIEPLLKQGHSGFALQEFLGKDLADVVFHHTGLNVQLKVADSDLLSASIVHDTFGVAHPILSQAEQRRVDALSLDKLTVKAVFRGEVNLTTGRVSGIFSELTGTLHLTTGLFAGKLTAPQLVGIVLHELGHFFTYLELLGHFFVANTVLADVSRQWADLDPVKRVELLLVVEKTLEQPLPNREQVSQEEVPASAAAFILSDRVAKIQSEAGTRWYDQRLGEAIADRFAVRHGGGADLAEGLRIITRELPMFLRHRDFNADGFALLSNFLNVFATVFKTVDGVVMVNGPVGMAVVLIKTFVFSTLLSIVGFMMTDHSYDQGTDRFKAIRRELVAGLKDPRLTSEQKRDFLLQIKAVDDVINKQSTFHDAMSLLTSALVETLAGKRQETQRQQLLERLTNNRLYEATALLSV